MTFFYNLFIRLYETAVRTASFSNEKARKWVKGRKNWKEKLKKELPGNAQILWFHAASLGEAEQGLPVIQRIRGIYPGKKILLTFFSPSGFENFQKSTAIDYIFYLPSDTPENARDFLEIVRPELAFFIKYEIWLNLFTELQHRNIPILLAPAVFREDQFYFKFPFSRTFLPVLKKINAILVQDQNSKMVLEKHQFNNVQICGDTRMDRIQELVNSEFHDPLIKRFCNGARVLVAGSSWREEEKIISEILSYFPDLKVILAPHDISAEHIREAVLLVGREHCALYSENLPDAAQYQVLIIDNIGLLSRLYRYGDMALIGGGFGSGIHNTIEAAGYGMPVLFGPRHKNFIEPAEMIKEGFGFEIHNGSDLKEVVSWLKNEEVLKEVSNKARSFVKSKAGATDKIVREMQQWLDNRHL